MTGSSICRRTLLQLTVAGAVALAVPHGIARVEAQEAGKTVTIAYNVNLPSFDPTVGASAVNPTIQTIYQAVFDPYIGQAPDLTFEPGILTDWAYNDDKTKIMLTVRDDAVWHNGDKVTPEDVVWSLERAGNPESGNPIQFVWSKIGNFQIDGNVITADVTEYQPDLFKWMAFLTGYVLPKKYYEEVGAEGFEAKPIGSGPYMVDTFERNAFLRLKANPDYWGGKPAFDTVIFKFVPDATSRVAEIESGAADVTLEIPYEEFDRHRRRDHPGLRHRDDLHQRYRRHEGRERPQGGRHVHQQEGHRRPAAARLRRAHRHAADAGIRRLRSLHHRAVRSGRRQGAA
mgnify:CR=1 FL=1